MSAQKKNTPTFKTLISSRQLQSRLKELGASIRKDYNTAPPLVVGLMNGSLFFLVDLLRHLPPETEVECWRVGSYAGTASTGKLTGLSGITLPVQNREVLLVDDILDTGLTLSRVTEKLLQMGASSVKTCVLLEKKRKKAHPIKADWVGFKIPDLFVVGYGLDLDGKYRGLNKIVSVKPNSA